MGSAHRPAHVAVMVAVMLVLLLGFAALAIDISRLGTMDKELATLVDNTSMSTMRMVANISADTDVGTLQKQAQTYAAQFMSESPVSGVALEPVEVLLGTSLENVNGRYTEFAPLQGDDSLYNAVRVTARFSQADGTGMATALAHMLGFPLLEVSRTSHAVLRPRNIVLCVDGSNSMQYDSQLQRLPDVMTLRAEGHMDATINAEEVWKAFPKTAPYNGALPSQPSWGPVWGAFMESTGYGTPDPDIDTNYDPRQDPGLLYLPQSVTWSVTSSDPDAAVQSAELTLLLTAQGYNAPEISAIEAPAVLNPPEAATDDWVRRVQVAIGLHGWSSGIPGGRGTVEGWDPGNQDNVIDENELVLLAEPPISIADWDQYVAIVGHPQEPFDFSKPDAPAGDYANFHSTFGVKTAMDYLKAVTISSLADHMPLAEGFRTTQKLQPWSTVRDAVGGFMDGFQQSIFNPNDRIALLRYGNDSEILSGLLTTGDLGLISDAMFDDVPIHGNTNIGACILDGIDVLVEAPGQPNPSATSQTCTIGEWGCLDGVNAVSVAPSQTAQNMIIVLTDGQADLPGPPFPPDPVALMQAYNAAEQANAAGIRVHAICMGVDSDADFCQELTTQTPGFEGLAFGAFGSTDAIGDQLSQIFDIFLALREDALLAFRE